MASLNSKFRSIRSRRWVGLLLVLMGLAGCGGSVDPKATEKALKEELAKQGVGSLKEVSCPSGMKAGQKFDCTGIFESGIGFRIPVEQKIEGNSLVWEIPSIKGMLNMNQVMKTMQSELKLGDGAIDCGTASTYRMVTLGSTFECTFVATTKPGSDEKETKEAKAIEAKSTDQASELPAVKNADQAAKNPDSNGLDPKKSAKKEPDKIEIAIASSGDVTWQRLVAAAPGKAGLLGGLPNKSDKNATPPIADVLNPEAQADGKTEDKTKDDGPNSPSSSKPASSKPKVSAEDAADYDS